MYMNLDCSEYTYTCFFELTVPTTNIKKESPLPFDRQMYVQST